MRGTIVNNFFGITLTPDASSVILISKLPETATGESLDNVAEVQTSIFDSLNVFGHTKAFLFGNEAIAPGR